MTNTNCEDMLAGRLHSGAAPYLYDLKAKASVAKARMAALSVKPPDPGVPGVWFPTSARRLNPA